MIRQAVRDGRLIQPLTALWPELTGTDAARIRDLLVLDLVAEGQLVVGAKAAWGSEPWTWILDVMFGARGDDSLGAALVVPRVAIELAPGKDGRFNARCLRACLDITWPLFRGETTRRDHLAANGGPTRLIFGEAVSDRRTRLVRGRVEVAGAARQFMADVEALRARCQTVHSRLPCKLLTRRRVSLFVSDALTEALPIELTPAQADFGALGRLRSDEAGHLP